MVIVAQHGYHGYARGYISNKHVGNPVGMVGIAVKMVYTADVQKRSIHNGKMDVNHD